MADTGPQTVQARFTSDTGEDIGAPLDLPLSINREQLQLLCNALLQQEESTPFVFYVGEQEVASTLEKCLAGEERNPEQVVTIICQQQAVFRVRAVTRCTSSLEGHAEAVIAASFSPSGGQLASGSGDTTLRLWDLHTQTPLHTCTGHDNWVLCVSWSPDGLRLASGCKSGRLLLWEPSTGKLQGKLMGHRKWITALAWEPCHQVPVCRRLASSSKDGDVRIWDVVTGLCVLTLAGHTAAVTALRWGGQGLLYSASQDRSVRVWRDSDGALCRVLQGHAHWVNTLALSTDAVLRTGPWDPNTKKTSNTDPAGVQAAALERYSSLLQQCGGQERLVSGSDDFTMFLWLPAQDKKPLARLTGHQQLINDVKFSPDCRLLASASFDKSVKLWDGATGKFLCSLRGHVQAVYVLAWAADSRLLLSGSADSTLKVWNMKTKKLEQDLPGHADAVFAVDWSPDGHTVVSGGKDKVLKLWQK